MIKVNDIHACSSVTLIAFTKYIACTLHCSQRPYELYLLPAWLLSLRGSQHPYELFIIWQSPRDYRLLILSFSWQISLYSSTPYLVFYIPSLLSLCWTELLSLPQKAELPLKGQSGYWRNSGIIILFHSCKE